MTERYICIHGHFYQPPRENPWLEAVELQDSAYPYHDWNERVTAECYAGNAVSRILDGDGRIVQMVNNYARMSFDFGPTLLAWLEEKAPDVYEAILEADRQSQEMFSGHGSAMAQAYNHMIMPLANRHDKQTQVIWGIRDFEHRFGRSPEGMWLPETAVDLETLEIMAQQGIRFTILAQHQAHRVRPIKGSGGWRDVSGGKIDPTMAYRLRLPSGRNIVAFFYDGPISRAVAFEGLLSHGESFARRLSTGFDDKRNRPQLMNIATDGESYGHHHQFGEMALAYALHFMESLGLVRIINYGEYLEHHPPIHMVEIHENTSWSCTHGVSRWFEDCGCNSGGRPGWNQGWRAPLRWALDWLRDTLTPLYERKAKALFKDPWNARDDYVQVLLDRSTENVDEFFGRHAVPGLSQSDKVTGLKLLELQRHAMLMYTSCGWFFDEISGIETVQVIQYAGRVIQLAREVLENDMEEDFLRRLEGAKSNIPEHKDGRIMYEKFVRGAQIDLLKVGAHYAVSSLFESYETKDRIFCYTVDRQDYRTAEMGKARLGIGRIEVASEITGESAPVSFAVIHFGDHNLAGGVRWFQGDEAYGVMTWEVTEAFSMADFPEAIRRIDRHFGVSTYSLRSLFRDEQRKIMAQILGTTANQTVAAYRQIYEQHAPLMRFLKDMGVPAPKSLYAAAELCVNDNLRRAFQEEDLNGETIQNLLERARNEGLGLDIATLEYTLRRNLERTAGELLTAPSSHPLVQRLQEALEIVHSLPFEVNLWEIQNICYKVKRSHFPEALSRAEKGDEDASKWLVSFKELGEKLSVIVD
jgi:alpha-amylase/alpha-mannosidase (GH57 family)